VLVNLSEIHLPDKSQIGGWETLDMVVRYTRSVKFEDSLKMYERAMKGD
jgi:hypothetical protein